VAVFDSRQFGTHEGRKLKLTGGDACIVRVLFKQVGFHKFGAYLIFIKNLFKSNEK
jgi:hypothetical protein